MYMKYVLNRCLNKSLFDLNFRRNAWRLKIWIFYYKAGRKKLATVAKAPELSQIWVSINQMGGPLTGNMSKSNNILLVMLFCEGFNSFF